MIRGSNVSVTGNGVSLVYNVMRDRFVLSENDNSRISIQANTCMVRGFSIQDTDYGAPQNTIFVRNSSDVGLESINGNVGGAILTIDHSRNVRVNRITSRFINYSTNLWCYDSSIVSITNSSFTGAGPVDPGREPWNFGLMYFSRGQDFTVRDCMIQNVGYSVGIGISDWTTGSVRNTTIRSNVLGGVRSNNMRGVVFDNNRITQNRGGGIAIQGSGNTVSNNIITDNQGYGVFLGSSANNTIEGNRFNNNASGNVDNYRTGTSGNTFRNNMPPP